MDYSNVDTDAILASVEQGQDYVQTEPQEYQHVSDQSQPQATQEPKYYEFSWNGQQVKGTEDQLIKWASQGYDYSQKMSQFNNQAKEFEQKYARYSEIDNFVNENPDWWQHVENAWQNRETYNLDPDIQKHLSPVLQELSQVKKFMTDYQREKIEQQAREEDLKLENEIKTLQQQYPDVDFSAKDDSGQSLEHRVIRYANERGIGNFTSAFRDYYHDSLAKIYESRGREAIQRELQQRKASGLLGQSPAPTQNAMLSQGGYQRPATYDEGYKNALRELGLEG